MNDTFLRRLTAALLALALAACGDPFDDGGGNGDSTPPPLSCSLNDQKSWLADYMNRWYFWTDLSPRPNPSGFGNIDAYYQALLYTGTDARFPADRWSFTSSTASFNSFFRDGETMGYGISVAGNEVFGQPNAPLYVRYVEPNSPAAAPAVDVRRGDQVISINGRTAAEVITANDFSGLVAANPGDQLTLVLRYGGADHTVRVTAATFALAPVPDYQLVLSPDGRRMGYVIVKDMINQVASPLANAFAYFRAQGVTEIILDLRYNGGGFVSVGRDVASYVAGTRGLNRAYASLLYNRQRAASNDQSFLFTNPVGSVGVSRVFVLTGSRTCSASEQVINGLRGVNVQVIAIGDTTCGKPVGFNSQDGSCGLTYSAVTFESVNDRNEGRYFDGFDATCPVVEDFTQPMGSAGDPLLVSAANFADTGTCPILLRSAQRVGPRQHLRPEAGEFQGMLAR